MKMVTPISHNLATFCSNSYSAINSPTQLGDNSKKAEQKKGLSLNKDVTTHGMCPIIK